MKTLLMAGVTTVGLVGLCFGAAVPNETPVEHVTAPGGKTTYYIMAFAGTDADGSPNRRIEVGLNGNTSFKVLLSPSVSAQPEHNLAGFSHLFLSPDAKTLYFEATAWATSNAVHALDVATAEERFVTNGHIACIVLSGEHQGDLIIGQHRYFVQGGSHDDLYMFEPTGKEVGLVTQGTNAAKVCSSIR